MIFGLCVRLTNAIKLGLGAEKVYLNTMCDGRDQPPARPALSALPRRTDWVEPIRRASRAFDRTAMRRLAESGIRSTDRPAGPRSQPLRPLAPLHLAGTTSELANSKRSSRGIALLQKIQPSLPVTGVLHRP